MLLFWSHCNAQPKLFLGKDSRGRIVSILIRRSDVGVNLGNICAPTNLTEQKNFFDSFHKFYIPSSAIIITGDFNCYNNALDKFSENVSIHREYKSLKSDFVHADVWHNWYPSAREFTWFDSTLSIGSRLGKFFLFLKIYCHLAFNVTSTTFGVQCIMVFLKIMNEIHCMTLKN